MHNKCMGLYGNLAIFCSLRTHLISGMIPVRPSLNPLNHLILLLFWVRLSQWHARFFDRSHWPRAWEKLFWVRGTTRFEIYAHYTRHLFEWIYRERCVGLYVWAKKRLHHLLTLRHRLKGWAFMRGLRYSPLHVTEFCGEMQGKFKVSLALLTGQQNVRFSSYFRSEFHFEKKLYGKRRNPFSAFTSVSESIERGISG